MKKPDNLVMGRCAPRLVRFFDSWIEVFMVCFFLTGITLLFFCLYKALHQHLIERAICVKGNPAMTCRVQKLDEPILLQEPLNIRVEKWMSATTSDYDTTKLPDLAIVFEQTKPSPLHSTKTATRAVIIISGTALRNVTLGDIMDQLRAVTNPLGDPSDGGTNKEESNLGKKVQPIGRAAVSEDRIHSSANVKVSTRPREGGNTETGGLEP